MVVTQLWKELSVTLREFLKGLLEVWDLKKCCKYEMMWNHYESLELVGGHQYMPMENMVFNWSWQYELIHSHDF